MVKLITLYDTPSKFDGKAKAWGPNTWKARWTLNYKQLPYKTVWVEYPDIKALSLEIGASPTSHSADGAPFYTLPAIYDPNTDKVVSESFEIAQYLDVTYTERPVLPRGSEGLQHMFVYAIDPIYKAIFSLAAPAIANSLNPVSHDYWRRTREIRVNSRLEDFSPVGAEREKKFQSLQSDLSRVAVAIQKNGGDARYVMGDQPSFADFAIAAVLMWANRMLNAEEWDKIMSFDSGRWKRFLEDMDEYATVDVGEAYKSKA